MKIEERNREKDKKERAKEYNSKANLVESGKNEQSQKYLRVKKEINFKKRQGTYYSCGKPGHYKSECRKFKNTSFNKAKKAKVNVFVAMVTEVNLIERSNDWIIDTGATKHICADRNAFFNYLTVESGDLVYMGSSHTSRVIGKGQVVLKLSSGKPLMLKDVLHVPDIRRNLVSVLLLNRASLKLSFEAGKVVITKSDVYVGKGYLSEGLFVLNVTDIMNEKASSTSIYMIVSYDIWHGRLGHCNAAYIKKLCN